VGTYLPLVGLVQLADTERGPIGSGSLDVETERRGLFETGYRGWITMEHHQGSDSRAAASLSFSRWQGGRTDGRRGPP
jgi:sugar phosphate isomerase/epimerase